MRFPVKRWGVFATLAAMLNVAACGYWIYPERQGLRGERVDGTVVALDAIGLLFFVLPGVIAFAVDFSTGCIYLPEGHDGSFSTQPNPDAEQWTRVAQVAPFADNETIAAALQHYLTGSNRNIESAHIEWRPASVFATPAFTQSTTTIIDRTN